MSWMIYHGGNNPLMNVCVCLLVHGICHLLGYDHIEDEDYEVMHAQETLLLKKLAAAD